VTAIIKDVARRHRKSAAHVCKGSKNGGDGH
jgi:hypothetical protein